MIKDIVRYSKFYLLFRAYPFTTIWTTTFPTTAAAVTAATETGMGTETATGIGIRTATGTGIAYVLRSEDPLPLINIPCGSLLDLNPIQIKGSQGSFGFRSPNNNDKQGLRRPPSPRPPRSRSRPARRSSRPIWQVRRRRSEEGKSRGILLRSATRRRGRHGRRRRTRALRGTLQSGSGLVS